MPGEPGGRAVTAAEDALPDAFAIAAEALAHSWPQVLQWGEPSAAPVNPEEALALTRAVAQALAGDLAPLAARVYLDGQSDEAGEIASRLDTTLWRLEAIRRVALDNRSLRARCAAPVIDAGLAAVARRVAVQAAATLAARAAAAEGLVTDGHTSMALTMHELRRPLTVMSGYTQLLAGGTLGDLTERGRAAAAAMVAASEVMLRLTEALAEAARLEDPAAPMEWRELDLAEVTLAAVAMAATEAALSEVVISADLRGELRVRGDHTRLTSALTNLLSNAVKHSPAAATVEVRGFMEHDHVCVLVRDHGPGFPPQNARRLFDKYYRDPEERARGIPGTGLGLFIVQTVAERHGGRVLARPGRGGGAEFVLILPALGARRPQPGNGDSPC